MNFLELQSANFMKLLLILLRKKQVPGENITSNAHRITVMKYEDVDKQAYWEQIPSLYFCSYWTRVTTKTLVKLGNLEGPIVVLVDHDLEINLMSNELYEMEN